jgi:hypothetical protein
LPANFRDSLPVLVAQDKARRGRDSTLDKQLDRL